jgi:DNA ligase-1
VLKNWASSQIAKGPNLLGAAKSLRASASSPNQANTPKSYYADLYELLDVLDKRTLSGQAAITEIVSFISRKENIKYKDLILDILDRDLKCRVSSSIINKVWPKFIPEFNTALANSYWDNEDAVDFGKDTWYASRKLDGVRLLTIIDEKGDIKTMSRNGKEFTSLTRLKEEIRELWPKLRSTVFDGEICIVDEEGDEHFDQIIRLVTRKDYTIPFPKYRVFDILTLDEFFSSTSKKILSERQARWDTMKRTRDTTMIVPLDQWKVDSREMLDKLFAEATEKGWEGLILRRDTGYKGKRSNDLLKVKSFRDAEYIVEDVVMGPFQMVVGGKEVSEKVLASVVITHDGNKVNVGSGFTIDQRREYYKNPKGIIGKTITVKYFEETTDQNGKHSLRFPIVKHIYEEERNA